MEFEALAVVLIIVAVIGTGAFAMGYFYRKYKANLERKGAETEAEQILAESNAKAREIVLEAKDSALKFKTTAEAELRERRLELQRQEHRLQQKEENLDRKLETAERRERAVAQKERDIETNRAKTEDLKRKQLAELERVSGLTSTEAKGLLLQAVEDEARQEATRRIREIEMEAKVEADERARKIISLSIQRCASDMVADSTVAVVPLPSDELKGRIIGREGRNIRALENATGVDLIIDDTPDAVTLSGFDPIRREVARLALNKLILDGRIHPARIEEVVQRAKTEVETAVREAGEQAAYEAGVHGLHPDLVKLIGQLKYRTSYGQNVLIHSVEVANLAGSIAAEMGADANLLRRAGLLHDIGKAVDHKVEGPHALLGADIVKRLDRSVKVVAAVAGHHGETKEPQTFEAIIVQVADAISGARPGARRETVENYIKRLEALESVANSFSGVEKSFAIQAGREIRIIVKPEEIDDLSAMRLARDVVKKIEESLEYPGQIKVTVVRETRAVDYAK
ncbi:MAG: ribonuclease Y [Bacteroidetes bacterium]|nr:ribonuclease Y [Bacteroidota bacterium]MCL5025534.1 ribonuclease Y [Chloroflexota bacterium]